MKIMSIVSLLVVGFCGASSFGAPAKTLVLCRDQYHPQCKYVCPTHDEHGFTPVACSLSTASLDKGCRENMTAMSWQGAGNQGWVHGKWVRITRGTMAMASYPDMDCTVIQGDGSEG